MPAAGGTAASLAPARFHGFLHAVLASAGTSTLAIAVAVATTVVVIALLSAAFFLIRSARALRGAAEELRRQTAEAELRLGGLQAQAAAELRRVDDLVGSAEAIAGTVGAASRLARLSFATPLIKMMAFGAGARRVASRLRPRPRRRSLVLRSRSPRRRR